MNRGGVKTKTAVRVIRTAVLKQGKEAGYFTSVSLLTDRKEPASI